MPTPSEPFGWTEINTVNAFLVVFMEFNDPPAAKYCYLKTYFTIYTDLEHLDRSGTKDSSSVLKVIEKSYPTMKKRTIQILKKELFLLQASGELVI